MADNPHQSTAPSARTKKTKPLKLKEDLQKPVNPDLKLQLEKDLSKTMDTLPTLASIFAADLRDPVSLSSLVNTLITSLPPTSQTEIKNNPTLAAQRRRLLAHQEAERVYAGDMANASGERTGFFALPAEIRNVIYRYCLVWPGVGCRFANIASQRIANNKNKLITIISQDFKPSVALLRTSSEVRDEALKMLYGGNTFSTYRQMGTVWRAFMQTISTHRHLVRRVQLHFDSHLRASLAQFEHSTILDKIIIYNEGFGGQDDWLAYNLANLATCQLKLRMESDKRLRDTDYGDGELESQRRKEAIKILEVIELGQEDPSRERYWSGKSLPEVEKFVDAIYDRIAFYLGLIKNGETLKQEAKVSEDIQEWKNGKAEYRRKRLMRLSFGPDAISTSDDKDGKSSDRAGEEN